MGDEIRVAPGDVVESGSLVAGHAEDVLAVHSASDARIESAMTGWTGSSAVAMAAKAAAWQSTTRTLSSRLNDHAEALHTSGRSFAAAESDNTALLSRLEEQASP